MARYRCQTCGTEFNADTSAPKIKLTCHGREGTAVLVIDPVAEERARIRWGLREALDGLGSYPPRREVLEAIDRIIPAEET